MARVMYIDGFSGAAGDMLLGALVDAGLPIDALNAALGTLGLGHHLRIARVLRAGVSATHIALVPDAATDAGTVPQVHDGRTHHHHHHHHEPGPEHHHAHGQPDQPHHQHHHHHTDDGSHVHRSLADIVHLIDHSALSSAGKDRAKALFHRLGEAEAAIHEMSIDDVHLHEVGALDSIIDIVGCVFAMEWFGIDDVVASPLNVGSGTVAIAHGTYPVPAPATTRLLIGVPVYSAGPQVELTTPTGALLVSSYAKSYGPTPPMTIDRVGYGAGTRDIAERPNVLRVLIGERMVLQPLTSASAVIKIECEIDDMNPQLFAPAMERLFEAGALDVFLTAIQMKKGRPGTLVTVLVPEEQRQAACTVLFRETTTIGVRFERVWRETLTRRWVDVAVTGGSVRVKVSGPGTEVSNAVPEFDDCVRIARATNRPVRDVQAEALRSWLTRG